MSFLISRRLVLPDGSFGGIVSVLDPVDNTFRCFGLEGFCKFCCDFHLEAVSSFRLFTDNGSYAYDVYSLPDEFYMSALDILH